MFFYFRRNWFFSNVHTLGWYVKNENWEAELLMGWISVSPCPQMHLTKAGRKIPLYKGLNISCYFSFVQFCSTYFNMHGQQGGQFSNDSVHHKISLQLSLKTYWKKSLVLELETYHLNYHSLISSCFIL
jgi:hypothetical protein